MTLNFFQVILSPPPSVGIKGLLHHTQHSLAHPCFIIFQEKNKELANSKLRRNVHLIDKNCTDLSCITHKNYWALLTIYNIMLEYIYRKMKCRKKYNLNNILKHKTLKKSNLKEGINKLRGKFLKYSFLSINNL